MSLLPFTSRCLIVRNRQYANILFINHYRLDTGKRRIAYLRFSDFVYMASVFIEHLTDRSSGGGGPLDELDAVLATDSRDLKYLLFASKETLEEYRGLVGMQLTSLGLGNIMERAGGQAFKTLVRYCLGLGAGLVHTKELKDLFVNLQGGHLLCERGVDQDSLVN